MAKTLLFLDGQTVILTSNDANSIVQDNPSENGREEQDNIKNILSQHEEKGHLERKLVELEGLGDTMHPNLVQVKVHGQDVPGFVLSEGDAGNLHKILNHSVPKEEFDLHILPSAKVGGGEDSEETEKSLNVENGGLLQVQNTTLHNPANIECSFASRTEENYRSNVFALTANSQLLQQSSEEGTVENGNHEESSLPGLQNIMQLPLVSGHLGVSTAETDQNQVIPLSKGKQVIQMTTEQTQGVQVEGEQSRVIQISGDQNQVIQMSPEQNQVIQMPEDSQVIRFEREQGQVASRSMQTFIAVIQGEDGSTQTIELSPEDTCKLNLTQMLNGNTETTETLCNLPNRTEFSATKPLSEKCNQQQPVSGSSGGVLEDSAVFLRSQNVEVSDSRSVDDPGGDGDASLGPFLLIPEYNADGTISMLQIRGSDSDVVHKSSAEPMNPSSVIIEEAQFEPVKTVSEKSSLSFPRPGQNVQKIRLPLNQPNKTGSLLKHKQVDWKSIATKPIAPRVPGSMYLRDIAMRTKFRNLTSFLDTKPADQEMENIKRKVHNTELPSRVTTSSNITKLNSSSILIKENDVSSSSGALQRDLESTHTVASQGNQSVKHMPHEIRPAKKDPSVVLEDSATLQVSQLNSCSPEDTNTHLHVTGDKVDKALTIKVSTGSIFVSEANNLVTSSNTSTLSSIKCTEYSDGGLPEDRGEGSSLTSIVYCSPSGDDPPFTVHFPGGDSTKPLGSSANPIQLVQQGNTFQAVQPVQERQLEQITSLLQQRRITAPPATDHDEIYDPKTNMKIVYKVVYPEDVLRQEEGEDEETSCGEEEYWMNGMGEVCKRDGKGGSGEDKRKGRKGKDPRKAKNEEDEDVDVENLDEEEVNQNSSMSVTRSGRISRPPKHMLQDYRNLMPAHSSTQSERDSSTANSISHQQESEDSHANIKPQDPVLLELSQRQVRQRRKLPRITRLRYTCLTCGKLYMGRIKQHYRKFPDHRRDLPISICEPTAPSILPPTSSSSAPIFTQLISNTQTHTTSQLSSSICSIASSTSNQSTVSSLLSNTNTSSLTDLQEPPNKPPSPNHLFQLGGASSSIITNPVSGQLFSSTSQTTSTHQTLTTAGPILPRHTYSAIKMLSNQPVNQEVDTSKEERDADRVGLKRDKNGVVPSDVRKENAPSGNTDTRSEGRVKVESHTAPEQKGSDCSEGNRTITRMEVNEIGGVVIKSEEGCEVNKSVLSPIPGTQASETSGEPGLPMETLTTQEMTAAQYALFTGQCRDGARSRRGGRRGSRRGGRSGRGRGTNPNMLEQILKSYNPAEIQSAVGARLVQNLTPWQLLCFQIDGDREQKIKNSEQEKSGMTGNLTGMDVWSSRLEKLESLLKDFREEFMRLLEPVSEKVRLQSWHGKIENQVRKQMMENDVGNGKCEINSDLKLNEIQTATLQEERSLSSIIGKERSQNVTFQDNVSDVVKNKIPSIISNNDNISIVSSERETCRNISSVENKNLISDLGQDISLKIGQCVLNKNQSLALNEAKSLNAHDKDSQPRIKTDDQLKHQFESLKVNEFLASVLGIGSGWYQHKQMCVSTSLSGLAPPSLTPSSSAADGQLSQILKLETSTLSPVKRPFEINECAVEDSSFKRCCTDKTNSNINLSHSEHGDISEITTPSFPNKSDESDSVDSVTKVLEDATRNLGLVPYDLHPEISTHLSTNQVPNSMLLTSSISSTSNNQSPSISGPHFSLSLDNKTIPHTSLTTSTHTSPCITHTLPVTPNTANTTNLPLDMPHLTQNSGISSCNSVVSCNSGIISCTTEIPSINTVISSCSTNILSINPTISSITSNISSGDAAIQSLNTSITSCRSDLTSVNPDLPSGSVGMPTMNSCTANVSTCTGIPLSNIGTSLNPTSTISQVNTIHPMPLGDLDITAEDLPRLLSEGTGIVVGAGGDSRDTCDAPKLLDSSGDTTDLSEMLFKLQEETARIAQTGIAHQNANLGSGVYHQGEIISPQQINQGSDQLLVSQALDSNVNTTRTIRSHGTVGTHPNAAVETTSHTTLDSHSHSTLDTNTHPVLNSLSHTPLDSHSRTTLDTGSHPALNSHSHTPLNSHSHTPLNSHSHTPFNSHSHTPLNSHSHTPINSHSHPTLGSVSHPVLNSHSLTPLDSHSHTSLDTVSHPVLNSHSLTPLDSHSHTPLNSHSHTPLNSNSHPTLDTVSHPVVNSHSHTPLDSRSHTPLNSHSHIPLNSHQHTPLNSHSHTPLNSHSHPVLNSHSHTPLDSHSRTPLNSHSHTPLNSHSHPVLNSHSHTPLDSHSHPTLDIVSHTPINSHSHAALDSHSHAALDSHSHATLDTHTHTALNSRSHADLDSHSQSALDAQGFSKVRNSLNQSPSIDTSQSSVGPSMPLLTFSGALDSSSEFPCTSSGINNSLSSGNDASDKISQDILRSSENQGHSRATGEGERSLEVNRNQLNLNFSDSTSSLGTTEFEELLKR